MKIARYFIQLSLLISLTLGKAYGQNLVPYYFFTETGARLVNESAYRPGKVDTIYCFLGNLPIYQVIINNGYLVKLDIFHHMESKMWYGENGRLAFMKLWDSTSGPYRGLSVSFNFYYSGRIWSGGMSISGIPHGTSFLYTRKGSMSMVIESDFGLKEGKCWTAMGKKSYGYATYIRGVRNGPSVIYNRKHRVIRRIEYLNGEVK
jgi:hypothetical protein